MDNPLGQFFVLYLYIKIRVHLRKETTQAFVVIIYHCNNNIYLYCVYFQSFGLSFNKDASFNNGDQIKVGIYIDTYVSSDY